MKFEKFLSNKIGKLISDNLGDNFEWYSSSINELNNKGDDDVFGGTILYNGKRQFVVLIGVTNESSQSCADCIWVSFDHVLNYDHKFKINDPNSIQNCVDYVLKHKERWISENPYNADWD